MIKINCFYNQDNLVKIEVSGHANFADYNQDIVCAGVSAIIFGGLNALDKLVKSEVILQQQNNKIIIEVKLISQSNQLILQTILCQLKTISEQYKKNVVIKEVY